MTQRLNEMGASLGNEKKENQRMVEEFSKVKQIEQKLKNKNKSLKAYIYQLENEKKDQFLKIDIQNSKSHEMKKELKRMSDENAVFHRQKRASVKLNQAQQQAPITQVIFFR